MALTDKQIKERLALDEQDPRAVMIEPFFDHLVESVVVPRERVPADIRNQYPDTPCIKLGIPSYGLSSAGYDLRLGNRYRLPKEYDENGRPIILDVLDTKPVQETKWSWSEIADFQPFVLQPGHMVLFEVKEAIRIPEDCSLSIFGKSTCARLGLDLNTTVGEPGWKGRLTLEISNIGHRPVCLYPGIGICQIVFHDGEVCETSYAKRKGKYQDATGIDLATNRRAA